MGCPLFIISRRGCHPSVSKRPTNGRAAAQLSEAPTLRCASMRRARRCDTGLCGVGGQHRRRTPQHASVRRQSTPALGPRCVRGERIARAGRCCRRCARRSGPRCCHHVCCGRRGQFSAAIRLALGARAGTAALRARRSRLGRAPGGTALAAARSAPGGGSPPGAAPSAPPRALCGLCQLERSAVATGSGPPRQAAGSERGRCLAGRGAAACAGRSVRPAASGVGRGGARARSVPCACAARRGGRCDAAAHTTQQCAPATAGTDRACGRRRAVRCRGLHAAAFRAARPARRCEPFAGVFRSSECAE